jgi:hypothetical protein
VEAAALLAESARLPLDLDLMQTVKLQQPLLFRTAFTAHGNMQTLCVSSRLFCPCGALTMLCECRRCTLVTCSCRA